MRAVLDTNILVSALISPTGNPAAIYRAWEEGRFTLLTCAEHLDELRATLQKDRVAVLIKPHKAGRLLNQIKNLAEEISALPQVERSPQLGSPSRAVFLGLRAMGWELTQLPNLLDWRGL